MGTAARDSRAGVEGYDRWQQCYEKEQFFSRGKSAFKHSNLEILLM